MGGRRNRRPSAGIIIAAVAIVAALAGTALAGTDATSSAVSKKKVKKIATKQINALAPELSVANAVHADNATNADTAANASALGGKPPSAYAAPTSYRLQFNNEVISSFADDATDSVTTSCDAGEHVAGGGGNSNEPFNVVMSESAPSGNGWRAGFRNVSGGTLTNAEIRVYAVCASP